MNSTLAKPSRSATQTYQLRCQTDAMRLGWAPANQVLDGVLLHAILPDLADQSPYLKHASKGWTLATYEF